MTTIADALRTGARTLLRASESPRLDAELLLGMVLGLSRSALTTRGDEPVAADHELAYARLIDRRLRGEPVAYLTGSREFWSLPLTVNPDVLVPRPETELLVQLALERLAVDAEAAVLDLGTGSGAVALAIASERPRSRITAVDISPPAIATAALNARGLGLSNVEFRLGSWFDAVPERQFDLIVANPPYVAASDSALEKLAAEPAIALNSGPTGLEALTAIAANAPPHLRERGCLIMEHGSGQAAQVVRLFERHGFTGIRSHRDLSGRPRVTLGIHNAGIPPTLN